MSESKIQSFKDLNSWKESHKLVLLIYRLSKNFPVDEKFGLTSQLRRCAVSISSNIAEGFGRNTAKDKMQFYGIAKGSILELENQLIIAKDLGYLKNEEFLLVENQVIIAGRLITGLMRTALNR